jgi:hypothetical protein
VTTTTGPPAPGQLGYRGEIRVVSWPAFDRQPVDAIVTTFGHRGERPRGRLAAVAWTRRPDRP